MLNQIPLQFKVQMLTLHVDIEFTNSRKVNMIGDAACEPTEKLVPIHQGTDKFNQRHDNFNFCASQLRIRVEMAFGVLTNKWGTLQRPLGTSPLNAKWLMQALARLHNFCINERFRLAKKGPLDDMSTAVQEGRAFVPTTPHDESGDPVQLDPPFKQ